MAILSERDIQSLVESEGVSLTQLRRSKHYIATCEFMGETFDTTISVSPSCHRWEKNARAKIRRHMRAICQNRR